MNRAFAQAALSVLVAQGVRCSIERHLPPAPGRLTRRSVLLSLGSVFVLGAVLLGWQLVVKRLAPPELRLTEQDLARRRVSVSPSPNDTASRKPGDTAPRSPRELAQAGLAAAASLRCAMSVGSGFFVAGDLLVTNAHVLCGASDSIQVTLPDQRSLLGRVERRSELHDVALVRVAGANARPLPLGDVGDTAAGDKVMIVGSPVGLDFSVQEGSISSLQRSTDGVAFVQLDAKVSPGNSGGPVIDGQGRVVAVVSRKVLGDGVEGIGLGLPINYIYGRSLNFVGPPSAAAERSAPFAQMVAAAESARGDMKMADGGGDAFDTSVDKPLLLSVSVDQYQRLVVRLVRITEIEPRYEEVTVRLWNGLQSFCTIKGDVSQWRPGDATLATSGLDSRTSTAFGRLTAGRALFVGESPLRWDLCDHEQLRPGLEIELVGGHPQMNRIKAR